MNDKRDGSKQEKETISIIVPVFNALATLPRCMRGLLEQTWRDLEILLIDDGSTDGSGALCDRYAQEDPRVRVLHRPHEGVAAARNAGLAAFTGDYLMFADADDLVDPRYAERLFLALRQSGAPVAYCLAYDCAYAPPEDYICEHLGQFCPGNVQILSIADYRFTRNFDSHRVVWGAVFCRSILSGLAFSGDYAVSTDTLFMAQVLHRCKEAAFLPERLYCYVLSPSSLSHRRYDRRRYDDVRVWEEVARLFSDLPGTPAASSRVYRDRKYQHFLRHMTIERSNDKALERQLINRVRFRFFSVFYEKASLSVVLHDLAFVTWPEAYLFLIRLRHAGDAPARGE